MRRAFGVRKSGLLDALEALFEAEWSRGAEIVVSAGEIGEIAPDAIDDVDAQLLSLLLAGLNDKAVAYQLGTSLRTVQRRVSHLMDLARVETRMQLGWQAARLGWSPSSSVTLPAAVAVARTENERPAFAGPSPVERTGIEPVTSGLQSRRSPS